MAPEDAFAVFRAGRVGDHPARRRIRAANHVADLIVRESDIFQIAHGFFGFEAVIEDTDERVSVFRWCILVGHRSLNSAMRHNATPGEAVSLFRHVPPRITRGFPRLGQGNVQRGCRTGPDRG